MMSAIRGRDTRAEVALRRQLFALGFRYRLHVRDLPGTPDLVFPKHGAVVQVHGCFWHRHGCSFTTTPASNIEFWRDKFRANQARDHRVIAQLRERGWRVAIVWECLVGQTGLQERQLTKLVRWLRSTSPREAKVLEIEPRSAR